MIRLLVFKVGSCRVGEESSNQFLGSDGRTCINLWRKEDLGLKMSRSLIVLCWKNGNGGCRAMKKGNGKIS